MPVVLPPLPYDEDELEPMVSRETLEFHHGKHHKAYVDKVNELIAGTELQNASLEEIIKAAKAQGDRQLLNQAGQAWNHDFFWPCLVRGGGGDPGGRMGELIQRDLGGADGFRARFKEEAVKHFASGWAWLCLKDGKLVVTSFHDGDTPVGEEGLSPLLTCDVWEHAYYLDYQNKRGDFVDAFLTRLINWNFVSRQLELAEQRRAA
jgi:superoxide dismutase, Fe-Mn family